MRRNGVFFRYCPKCGTNNIQLSKGSVIDTGSAKSSASKAKGGIPLFSAGVSSATSSNSSIKSRFQTRYVCLGCGYVFDNGGVFEVLDRYFLPSDIFAGSWAATGYANFSPLLKGINSQGTKINRMLAKLKSGKSTAIRLKKLKIKLHVEKGNDRKRGVVFILKSFEVIK